MTDHADHDLPADDLLIDFINQQPTPPKVKEIAKAFGLAPDMRAPLRRRLKSLAEDGRIKPMDGRRVAGLDHLPPVMVVEITSINDDGEGIAAPLEQNNETSNPPLIRISHERRTRHQANKTFAVGDRILAKLALVGPDEYQGQVIRKLDRHRQVLFG